MKNNKEAFIMDFRRAPRKTFYTSTNKTHTNRQGQADRKSAIREYKPDTQTINQNLNTQLQFGLERKFL